MKVRALEFRSCSYNRILEINTNDGQVGIKFNIA